MGGKKMVLVEWADAVHQFGWQDGEDVEQHDDTVYSIGYLMKKDKRNIILAQTIGIGNHAQTLQIPLGMVRKITELKEGGVA